MKRTLLALVSVAAIAGAASAQTYRETVISYGVDGLPQTSTVVNATGPDSVTTFDWDEFGNLINVSDAAGRQVGATYDPVRRMLTMTGAAGTLEQTHTRYRYDANGRLQYADISSDGTATPPSWVTSEVTYHASGQAASVIDPAGDTQSFGYYNNGWLHTATDGEGRQTRNTYWDDGLLMSTYEAYGTAEATRTHLTWYDALGQREQLRPANGIGSAENASQGASWQAAYSSLWGFDAYSRVNGWSLPQQDDGTRLQEQYDYDAAGNMDERITRAGQTISIEHDTSNRPWRKTTPEGVTVTTYNEAGEVRRITGPDQHSAGSWQLDYDYDFAGRMEYETITTPEGVARSVSYEYDAAGNRTRIIWPDGVSAEYIYDDANRIKEIWMDNADGSIKLRLASYAYDDQGRLETYRLYRMTTNIAAEIGFGYQVDGDLETMAYTLETGPDFTATYDYDRAGWLTDRSIDNPTWDWTPSTSSVTLTSESYSRNRMDQYTAVSGQALSYDDNGNLTSDGARSYVFSSENQLLSATTTSGTTDYSYGPAARRLRKATPDGAVTDFVLAGDMVIAEYVNGQLARRYLPGPGVDQRVAVIHCDTSTTCQAPDYANFRAHFYLPDRQGNVLATVGPFGDVQEQYHYTPFGVEMVGDPTGNPFRYTGRYFDAETGLYYYRARYYDADLGRFLSVDPIGYADQLNLYAYVGNSPLNATDPTGMYRVGPGNNCHATLGCRSEFHLRDRGDRPSEGELTPDDVEEALSYFPVTDIIIEGHRFVEEPSAVALGIFVVGMAPGPNPARAADEMVTLFRAVDEAEFQQILGPNGTNAFEAAPNSLGGKWLAESAEDAARWGEVMNGSDGFRLLEVELPAQQADNLMRYERLDGIGPARYGELDELTDATIREFDPG